MDDLVKRVNQFRCLELPGQPRLVHIGTHRLVDNLWQEIKRLRAEPGDASDPKELCKICGEYINEHSTDNYSDG